MFKIAALWHYLGTYNLDFRCENNSTPGILIEEIRYGYLAMWLISLQILQFLNIPLYRTIPLLMDCLFSYFFNTIPKPSLV